MPLTMREWVELYSGRICEDSIGIDWLDPADNTFVVLTEPQLVYRWFLIMVVQIDLSETG